MWVNKSDFVEERDFVGDTGVVVFVGDEDGVWGDERVCVGEEGICVGEEGTFDGV